MKLANAASSISEQKILAQLTITQKKQVELFNDQQYRAFIEIVAWSQPRFANDPARILVGYSGSGKTFCLKLLAQVLPRVVLCAPTNKAVKELQKLQTGQPCCTIYSLLGLRMEQHEDQVVLTKTEVSKINKYRFVILDEAGMVNSALFAYIKECMQQGIRFLFVGDPKQLPPVGEDVSPVWDQYPTLRLLKVVRHDNQILDLATRVRKTSLRDLVLKSDHTEDEGVWYQTSEEFEQQIIEYARQGKFDADAKVLAWRNRTVDRYNQLIRRTVHGNAVKQARYLINDQLVFTAPCELNGQVEFTTDDEVLVKHIVVAKHPFYDLKCYFLTVNNGLKEHIIRCIHEDDESTLLTLLNELANQARTPGQGRLWREFWGLKNSLASVKFAMALTVHRAQGSTFENVFVDCEDILCNSNKKEAKKCLYVAVSRPTKRLFMS